RAPGANPPQTKTWAAYTPGGYFLQLDAMPMTPPTRGWIRVGNQYARYEGFSGNPNAANWTLNLCAPTFAYGVFTVPIPVGDVVEWVDNIADLEPHGLQWNYAQGTQSPGDDLIRTHPRHTPVVVLAMAQAPIEQWPPLQGFVQD